MDDLSIIPCLHRNIVTELNGEMHFSVGEVWDDIQERLLCLDCMEYVTEVEVRSAQSDFPPNLNHTTQMEVFHDHA
ncbi:MAG: hypothetical protein MHPDNHAH_02825 [Anaerolineales bacterium]|nr:hypothetical protein [Anaerolineales bacterium]